MADLKFTAEEIYNLTKQLSSAANKFGDKEWELLLTIFANGTDRIKGDKNKEGGTLPMAKLSINQKPIIDPRKVESAALRDQLHHSYVPGRPRPKPMIIRVTPPPPGP